ncbi:MAG TPA: metal ABC transporter ATP-binding protein [Candidatus Ozemobacteraceae bacterium]|nr:metal ABC transporter ATP-binding protein [Candidatus Ozemobacteraceae bacterium]
MTGKTAEVPGASPPLIRCRDVCVGYDQELVLDGVDLEVPRGAFVPFVGPNGAGKTTLLRAILGLLPLRAGTIETPFDTVPAGFVPQHQSIDLLFPVVTRDIVMMGLYPRLGWWGRPLPADRELVDHLLVRFNLSAHSMKAFHELSGGMRQKVLIARALVTGADVLVMDEPTASLDADSEGEVIHLLHELAVRDGKTVLFAQHGLDLIRHLTDEVCRVHHGKARIMPWRELHLDEPEVRAHA